MKKTKIIATVGPVTESRESLAALFDGGVNILRFNFSHAKHEGVRTILERVRELNDSGRTSLSTLLDTKGPEIRTGDVGEKLHFKKGETFRVYVDQKAADADTGGLFCDYPYLLEDLNVGESIRIDSGLLDVTVLSKNADSLTVRSENDAVIGSRRHVNLPNTKICLPGVTDKDREDILFGIAEGMDFIAMSFVRTKENVEELRTLLSENGASHVKIIAKIENREGLENLEDILVASDGVMVARGDLGIEVPIETLPLHQKEIVRKAREMGKFCIVATHMLETMIDNPFPTRAEVSDIFNAVAQRTDATMLSGETTTGKYPLQAVAMMKSVIESAESHFVSEHKDYSDDGLCKRDIEKKVLIKNAIYAAEDLGAEAILVFTKTGRLARLAGAYRPNVPVFAFTGRPTTVRFVNALFGIEPILLPEWSDDHQANLEAALRELRTSKRVSETGRVVAVTDVIRDGKEVPALEIIDLSDRR
ncbi:MAG: Pyruvate kinase [Patescibacteria group bacterium]|nr:Pyruvate kinase [Patescibacteria group bacterium]